VWCPFDESWSAFFRGVHEVNYMSTFGQRVFGVFATIVFMVLCGNGKSSFDKSDFKDFMIKLPIVPIILALIYYLTTLFIRLG
jgi:hypothetical protein